MRAIVRGQHELDEAAEVIVRGMTVIELPKDGSEDLIPVHDPGRLDSNLSTVQNRACDLIRIARHTPGFRRGEETQGILKEVMLRQIASVETLVHRIEPQASYLDWVGMDVEIAEMGVQVQC